MEFTTITSIYSLKTEIVEVLLNEFSSFFHGAFSNSQFSIHAYKFILLITPRTGFWLLTLCNLDSLKLMTCVIGYYGWLVIIQIHENYAGNTQDLEKIM